MGEYSFIIVFILIFIVYVLTCNGLTWSGMMNIFRHSTVVGIIAIGMGLICLTGEIDLSVGSMLAFDAGFSVIIFNMTDSIVLTLLFALVFGAACGAVNGALVGFVKMPAFIVTLATMLIYRSFAQYFCQHMDKELLGGGSSVYRMANNAASYQPMYQFGNGKIATIPIVGLILIIMTVLFVYIATSTKYGKKKIPERSVSPDAVDDYQARFIDDLKYRYPPNRWPQVMISPEFASNINRLELLCGNRRANLSTYINNVLEQHFRDCEAQIKEFKKKYNDNE